MIQFKFAFFILLTPCICNALVAPDGAMALTDPSGDIGLNWDYVLKFNNSSAVAIDPYWLLTVAHVADDAPHSSVVIGATTYNQIGEVYHPTADLALIQLDAALPDYYQIYTGGYAASRPEVAMVGYGGVGTITDTKNFTVGSTGRGTRRWATNKIDNLLNYTGGTGKENQGFQMFFDTSNPSSGSTNEGGVGSGDSGGAVFYDDGGTWKLAGIMSDASTAGTADSVLAIDVQQYEAWIVSVIPELPSWMLAGLSLSLILGAGLFRRS